MAPSRPAALIVDDQPFVGMVASDILRESGFQTFHAYDAQGAEALLREHPEIGVILTEAELPGEVTGLDLCRRVSQERPHVQLVVTSADHDFPAAKVPHGARVLHKPFASGELRTVVDAAPLFQDA